MFAAKNELLTRPSGGYTIARSVRFRSSASAYLNRTPIVASSRTTWTWSGWVKRGTLGSIQQLFMAGAAGADYTALFFNSTDTLSLHNVASSANAGRKFTSALYRDPSAWYHMVAVFDTTNATANDRVILYVNGVRITSYSVDENPSASQVGQVNNNVVHTISKNSTAAVQYIDGYLTEVNFIDGAALTPSSFGTFNSYGVWQPKKYSGTYGTNGFYLNFSSNSTAAALGTDFSGNSNTWTVNNISVTAGATYDSMTDVPTLTSATVANYAVLNPLFAGTSSYLSNGNLTASISAANTNVLGTIQIPTSGKFYWEYQITTIAGGGAPMGGIATTSSTSPAVFYRADGNKIVDGTQTSYGATYTTTDTIGVAVDVDGGTIAFYKNNTSQGNITYAAAGFYPALRSNAATDVFNINFGQQPFTYTPPSGFVALNTYNLSTPTIPNGAAYMAATTYTGTGATQSIANTVNGTNFQPDFVWFKSRATTYAHALFDSVRGVTKGLETNSTGAEQTSTAGNDLSAFTSTGFTVGAPQNWNSPNNSGSNPVAWQWKANGTGVSNTSGTITSTVSANTTAGFAVVTYTGTGANATVGHGLGVAPSMIIFKSRTQASVDWPVYHISTGNDGGCNLNEAAAKTTSSTRFNNTTPTSTVFSVGSAVQTNGSTQSMLAYVFAAVAGYSAFGSYTGNGSADGPFVFLGFRPRFFMLKLTSGAGESWVMYDTARSTYNAATQFLVADQNIAELSSASFPFDFVSNGIKIRNALSYLNTNGATYIYMAFAENPFKYSLAR